MDCLGLPDNFRYEISDCKIIDRDSYAFSATITVAVKSDAEVMLWVKNFSRKTNTQWVVRSTYPTVERLAYRTDYVCQHSDRGKGKGSEKLSLSSKDDGENKDR